MPCLSPSPAALGRRAALLLAAAAILAGSPPATAGAPQTLSGASPFSACKLTGEKGRNFLNAVVEPWAATDPRNSSTVIAAWQQDRWSNGGARGIVTAFSGDGGQTWKTTPVPGISKCSGGTGAYRYARVSDPWVSIAADGSSYVMSLAFTDPTAKAPGANAMLVSRSDASAAGPLWSAPIVLRRDTDPRIFNDKNSLTADPNRAARAYATWDQLFDTAGGNDGDSLDPAAAPPPRDGVVIARQHLRAARSAAKSGGRADTEDYYTGPTWFARTTDGGRTWEPARMVYDPGKNAQTIANQAVIARNGNVLLFWSEIFATGETRLRVATSTDFGLSFGTPVDVAVTQMSQAGTFTPDTRRAVRDGSILFDVAIDPNTDRLYVVWQDARQDGIDRVAFSQSSDLGTTWSAPVFINKTPVSTDAGRNQAFTPSVAVDDRGHVAVTYYDFRNDRPKTRAKELTDYWAIICTPSEADCRSPGSWGNERRLTSTSFNMLNAPNANGLFVGDYQGLVNQHASFLAVFGITTTRNRTSIVSTPIQLPAPPL